MDRFFQCNSSKMHDGKGSMVDFNDRNGPHVREASDAEIHEGLKADPTDHDAKFEVALDELFPTSDAPSHPPGVG